MLLFQPEQGVESAVRMSRICQKIKKIEVVPASLSAFGSLVHVLHHEHPFHICLNSYIKPSSLKFHVLRGEATGTVVALLQGSCAGKLKKLDAV